jgi:hypothetical protein
MKVGRVTASDGRRIISFEPVLEDQTGLGEDRLLGFGGQPKALRLTLRVIPPRDWLRRFYKSLGNPSTWPPSVVKNLDRYGVLGIVSTNGEPLGLPAQFLNVSSKWCVIYRDSPGRGPFPPAVDLKYTFNTEKTAYPEIGAIVHRFMGEPETAVGPGLPPITGVVYNDHEEKIYGPHIADTAIDINGLLSGHPVEFIENVFDDYNHPPPTSPTAPDPIFKIPFGVGTPITASYGCRFQHIYRRGDCSPDVPAFEDTILDLTGLAWAPIGGWVTAGLVENMTIAIADSHIIPNTTHYAGIPNDPLSGLGPHFEKNYLGSPKVVVGEEVVGGPDLGVPYHLNPRNLFKPKNAGKQFNYYLPWPAFQNPTHAPGFAFNSLHSLLIEYRLDRNWKSPLPISNGFSFHAGIISSLLPRFRVYSRGDNGTQFGPVYAASYPERYPIAWGPVNPPGIYGDNARYFMIFNYVKRVSRIESFLLGVEKGAAQQADFLTPVIYPPPAKLPAGTVLDMTYQTAEQDHPSSPMSPWVQATEVERLNHGPYADYDFFRFRAIFEANVEKGIVPAIDTVVIPYIVK